MSYEDENKSALSLALLEYLQTFSFVAITSFSIGSPIRFAKYPARTSPCKESDNIAEDLKHGLRRTKLPVGTTKRIFASRPILSAFRSELYAEK